MVKQYNSKAVDMFQKSSLLCFNVLLSHVVFSENLSSKIAGQPRLQSVYIVENLFKYVENLSQPFKHITDVNEAIVLVQGGVEEVDVIMVNYFNEGAPEFEIAESMSDEYYRIKVRFEIYSLTLILESWKKKSKTRDHHRACFSEKKSRAQHCINLYTLPCFGFFFPESTLGYGPKKWHIFLFSAAYFLSYWHMPFEIWTIVQLN